MLPRLIATDKTQLKQLEQSNKIELSDQEKADRVKAGRDYFSFEA